MIPVYIDDVPEGWRSLFDDLLSDLEAINPYVEVDQAKEKFAELRVYLNSSDEALSERVAAARELSIQTCQFCGSPGTPRKSKGGRYHTACEQHAIL